MVKSILIGLAIISGLVLALASWYIFLFIGLPIGIIYLVHQIRSVSLDHGSSN